MGTRTQRVRRNNVLETGITPHTDPSGLWALGLDAGRKGVEIQGRRVHGALGSLYWVCRAVYVRVAAVKWA